MRVIQGMLLALLWAASAPAQEAETKRPPLTSARFGCHSHAGDADLAALRAHLELKEIDVISDDITDAGLAILKSFPNLEILKLNSSTITDRGLEHVAAIPKLRELLLCRTKATADGIGHLKKSEALRKLWVIRIPVTADVVTQLKELTRLESLGFAQLTPESREKAGELVTLLPNTKVSLDR